MRRTSLRVYKVHHKPQLSIETSAHRSAYALDSFYLGLFVFEVVIRRR